MARMTLCPARRFSLAAVEICLKGPMPRWQTRSAEISTATSLVPVLPHTIHGFSDLAQLTSRGFEIYLREPGSYESMLANGARADRVHLGHDMTFYLPADHFSQVQSKGAGTLYCLRQDDERIDDQTHPENVDLSSGVEWQVVDERAAVQDEYAQPGGGYFSLRSSCYRQTSYRNSVGNVGEESSSGGK